MIVRPRRPRTVGGNDRSRFDIRLSDPCKMGSGLPGSTMILQVVGSGMGIPQIKGATVEFGATDMPLKPEELEKLGLGQFPIVIGGVVPVVNIDGVRPGEIRFSGELLANIFLGKIRTWNDPAIGKLNPDLKLPNLAITVVHRSDGSGTTFNFSELPLQGQIWIGARPLAKALRSNGRRVLVARVTRVSPKLFNRRTVRLVTLNMRIYRRTTAKCLMGWSRTAPASSSNLMPTALKPPQ